jgi:hypothetical protein
MLASACHEVIVAVIGHRRENEMKKAIAFLAGAIFTAALIVTCGGGGGGGGGAGGAGIPTTNVGPSGPGVGDARAQGQPAVRTVWQYAYLDVEHPESPEFRGPAGVVEDFSACTAGASSPGTPYYGDSDGLVICELNVLGADGWELVAHDTLSFYLTRPQQ